MNAVKLLRLLTGVTQQRLAEEGGTSQSTIAAYESGAKSPTLRTLENLARSQRLEARVSYVPPLTREDRRSLAFHHAIAQRIRRQPEATIQKARQNLERLSALHPHAGSLFSEWQAWLRRPPAELIANLLDPSPHAREMRQVSPFSGLLSPRQRARILQRFRDEEVA